MQVIQFPSKNDNTAAQKPKYGYQYLFMCKEILDIHDYEQMLLSIMDEDYYQNADIEIRAMVDAYFTFEK